ncbi:MAG: Photosystem I assembly protein Ycf3 [Saprospiraceae bacterium]|nr:Photosystem I assembly protein Ycf3 [Saprospiraceae bacterium]
MRQLYVLCFWFGLANISTAQSKTDSLWAIWSDPRQADTVRLEAIQELAWSLFYKNPDSTALLAQMEFEFADKVNNKKWQGTALNMLGGTYHMKGDFMPALNEYKKALNAFMDANELKDAAAVYNNMGMIYRAQGNTARALEFYEKYLDIGGKLQNTSILATAHNNLGNLYRDLKNYAKALEYYERGLQFAEKKDNKASIAVGYNNIGSIYYVQKKYPQALEYYGKSIEIRQGMGDQRGLASVFNNIGLLYKEQKDFGKALEYNQKAMEIREKLSDKAGLAESYFQMGETFAAKKDFAKATTWCTKSLIVSEQIGALDDELDACQCLYHAYKGMGQSEKALAWHERFVLLNDSLQKAETEKRLEQMEFAKQVLADSLGQEEEKLKMEMAYRSEVRKRDKVTNFLLVSGLVVLALAVGFWSRMLYFRKYSEMFQHKAENLEKQQLLNEIALLKTQVNPHFLFNSLSILSSLVRVNPDLSEQFIDQLSRSYRYILEQKEQSLVSLRTELEFIQSYAFLLKIRFEKKFDLRFNLPDDTLDQYKIAPLTLQLLVENAVKHNRMSLREPLVVEVFMGSDQTLIVKNRLQLRPTPAGSTGLGLQNIINRYALLTDRPVWAGEQDGAFVVKLPLLLV